MQISTTDVARKDPILTRLGLDLTSVLAALALCACKPAPPPAVPPPPAAPQAPSSPPTPEPEPPVPAPVPDPEPDDDPTRCTCPEQPLTPSTPEEDGAEDDDVPEDLQARRARRSKRLPKPLATRLRAALPELRHACDVTANGPCTLQADFDGDGLPDDAILVRSQHNAGGIAILWGKGGSDLLGAGRHQCWSVTEQPNIDGSPIPEPCLTPIDPDLAWVSHWSLLTRTLAGPTLLLRRPASTKAGYRAPGAVGDAMLLDSGDSATAVYRTTTGWTLMYLGF